MGQVIRFTGAEKDEIQDKIDPLEQPSIKRFLSNWCGHSYGGTKCYSVTLGSPLSFGWNVGYDVLYLARQQNPFLSYVIQPTIAAWSRDEDCTLDYIMRAAVMHKEELVIGWLDELVERGALTIKGSEKRETISQNDWSDVLFSGHITDKNTSQNKWHDNPQINAREPFAFKKRHIDFRQEPTIKNGDEVYLPSRAILYRALEKATKFMDAVDTLRTQNGHAIKTIKTSHEWPDALNKIPEEDI